MTCTDMQHRMVRDRRITRAKLRVRHQRGFDLNEASHPKPPALSYNYTTRPQTERQAPSTVKSLAVVNQEQHILALQILLYNLSFNGHVASALHNTLPCIVDRRVDLFTTTNIRSVARPEDCKRYRPKRHRLLMTRVCRATSLPEVRQARMETNTDPPIPIWWICLVHDRI